MFTKELATDQAPDPDSYVVQTHGGLGDCLWVHKKLANADKPITYLISCENRARPRRAGILADHLPNVAGWRFDDSTFCPGGADWGPTSDPACALDKTWAQIKPKPGQVLRLECNRHLESGKRIEDWLPDLPTTHHFPFLPEEPPTRAFKTPRVVFHLAGWPDVPDPVWVRCVDQFANRAHAYIVGGSYDLRPRRLRELLAYRPEVTLLEDLPWADLVGVLRGALFCFGHASGFTAIADVLKVPGAVVNPRQHPRLLGTWNSRENPAQVHLTAAELESAVVKAAASLAGGAWPPASLLPLPEPSGEGAVGVARGAARLLAPREALVFAAAAPDPGLAAAVLHGTYDEGKPVRRLALVGQAADAPALARAYAAAGRSSIRPAFEPAPDWPSPHADGFDLVVVHAAGRDAAAGRQAAEGWARLNAGGGLLLVGPAAPAAAAHLPAAEPVGGGFWARKSGG